MTLAYGNMPLDRATNQRKNKRWLAAEFSRKETLFCVINDGQCLFEQGDVLSPIYLSKSQVPTVSVESCIYLGKGELKEPSLALEKRENDRLDITITGNSNTRQSSAISIFAIDFDKLRFSTQEVLCELGQWQGLRKVTASLSAIDASILALAKGLVHWHKSHQFCGQCGHVNRSVEAGHARRCSDCRNMSFPRTDPAVIMLVEKMFADGIPRCLLGRQASWAEGMYSTLAGFVDPGETLEQAVIREVVEETAIHVENPQYIASQPWPFPASVMLGFTAVATSDNIDISQDDLEDAQWFSREQLANFGVNSLVNEKQDVLDKPEYKMSSVDSISSYLITAWKNKEIGQY
ncbi:NAD(+) diphosphatase [Colwellia psychrerythraea]|uniref:NAD(+) diphosphatase n=1 Tax=Colwellia psychrerythraea TaxID=28229 RepID=A0A099KS36_COLPS|nr:NAD(+) diphosphatase [Colwellia psychrerythraea]KGJ93020.1 NAD(+) diphosphatase [Colwellia psychrerythraea]